MTSEASPAAAGAKKAKKDESGGGGSGSSSSTAVKKSKKKKSETTTVKTEDVSTPSSPAPPPPSNSNPNGANQTIDIPIFTEEFLEHNKVLSHASFLFSSTFKGELISSGLGDIEGARARRAISRLARFVPKCSRFYIFLKQFND